MGLLAWVVAPAIIPHTSLHPLLVHWMLIVVGMMWQFVVALAMAGPGLDQLAPRPWRASYANLGVIADPQFQGQWWILGIALTHLLFNYLLGEELLFHGVLLPRMAGVFGRWDWIANTVLFGLYHVHKIWAWPSMITSSFGYAWAAKRFRSLWMSVIVHGIEGYFIVLVVAVLAGWYPWCARIALRRAVPAIPSAGHCDPYQPSRYWTARLSEWPTPSGIAV
jgi:CAAX protease family protein